MINLYWRTIHNNDTSRENISAFVDKLIPENLSAMFVFPKRSAVRYCIRHNGMMQFYDFSTIRWTIWKVGGGGGGESIIYLLSHDYFII